MQQKETNNQQISSLIEIPSVSFPTGGGAIKGIDEQFKVNTANGTASFSIPLPLSQTRNGMTPALGLSYNSGAGNSCFGLGWQLNSSSINIKTDRSIPKYNDLDTYQISGNELVPYLKPNDSGTWEKYEETINGYNVKRYRQRIEGAFSKIEKIKHDAHGTYWKVTSKDNVATIYGRSQKARIVNPENTSQIYEWLAELTYDDKGNWIKYNYKEEDLENVPNNLHEKQRLNGTSSITNQYLKNIQYGNCKAYYPRKNGIYNPLDPTLITDSEDAKHVFQVVFDYGEHDKDTPISEEETELKWSARADAFSSYRSGFEIRTYRLCKRVLLFHHFEQLGTEPCLVKSLELNYEASNINNSSQSETTYLSSAIQSGFIKKEDGSYSKKSFPAMTFNYQKLNWQKTIQKVNQNSLINTPVGLTNNYQWTDLYGEGISGILTEQAGCWYYNQNLGNIDKDNQFTPAQAVASLPSFKGLNKGTIALQDLEANGEKQIVINSSVIKGFYNTHIQNSNKIELTSFKPFKSIPNINWKDANTRFIDLNGDGRPELVVSEENAFVWYENIGKEGYKEGVKAIKCLDENLSPSIIFSDSTQSIFLADLSGDGLTDIVRIRNGEICYWANKGYGKFSQKITMSNSPVFDYPDTYNPAYLHLADISGTGATDIIYLGKNKFKAYINLSGNSWSEVHDINPFIPVNNHGKLSVIDLFGTGTSCIVWSSDLPNETPMRYIDLMGSKKPHIMTGYNNSVGKEVVFEYRSSTYFYLKDKKEGNPWITKLPFPVQVVSKNTSIDHISDSQISTSYQYHHGYYDTEEREFRGFGMVAQTDYESFEKYKPDSDLDIPPIMTKTWIHTGCYKQQSKFSKQYQQEYYQDNSTIYQLPDSVIENYEEMTYHEIREATRALKGSVLRQELYALDGSEKETIPYTITETNFSIKTIQPLKSNKHSVYQKIPRETFTYNCERNISDPRVSHEFLLDSDKYGHPLQTIKIAYPRKNNIQGAYPEQLKLNVSLQKIDYKNEVDNYYRLGLPVSEQQFEINGLSLNNESYFTFESLISQLENVYNQTVRHDQTFTSGVQARLLSWKNNYYKADGLEALALPDYSESIVISQNAVQSIYDTKVDEAMMEAAGYIQKEGYWWIISEKPSYLNASQFYLPYQIEDAFTNTSSILYDDYYLTSIKRIDALGNETQATLDYRTLTIKKIIDINDTISEAIFDELGMVIATSTYGTEEGIEKGDIPLSEYLHVDASLTNVIDNPNNYLQQATNYFYYHIQPWEAGNLPPHFVQLQRETHVSELLTGQETQIQITLGYSDGFGRELQNKVKMDENEWLVSGRTVYNNKEKPVKQYEPFITNTHLFQTEEDIGPIGVTPILYYDALGRLIKTETPNGFHSKVIFNPWQVSSYDANDTVLESRNYTENNALIGTTDPKGLTLEKALAHKNTPTTTLLDSLGREFMTVELKEENGTEIITHTKLDFQGNILNQTDPRQFEANKTRDTQLQVHNFSYHFDLLGNPLKTISQDAGTTYTLINAVGNPLYAWSARDYRTNILYDELHRPLQVNVSGNGMDKITQKQIYGTDKTKNENSQLLIAYDQSGKKENKKFDFKGQPQEINQQLCKEYKTETDWQNINAVEMESEIYTASVNFDAIGRPIKNSQPDGSVHTPTYYHIGWLKAVNIKLREAGFGVQSNASATTFVEHIDYDAKGQRTQIRYGNGVQTNYTYNPKTFRLSNLLTLRDDGTILQDISYIYDPVGNIVSITDNSHNRVFNAGQVVDATMDYVYDALYQLKEATGREHLALGKTDYQNTSNNFKTTQFANINEANRLKNYKRLYQYDDSGNMTQLRHVGENSFTRNITVSANSNRAITDEMDTNLEVDSYFDTAGNLVKLEHIQGISWNYRNHIAAAAIIERDSENDAEYYVYDSTGQRTRKVKETYNSTGDLIWVEEKIYLGGVEIKKKYQGSTKVLKENRSTLHIMDNQRIALVHYWDLSSDTSVTVLTNKIHYQLGNHLGSASLELDANGQLISYEEYFPFGGTSFTSGTNLTEVKLKEYRYTGKERDDVTGLYYYGARYYASWLCRWLNPDPAGTVDGLNLFRYVRNNPIMFIDPDGKEPTRPIDMTLEKHVEIAFDKKIAPSPYKSASQVRIAVDVGGGHWVEGRVDRVIQDLDGKLHFKELKLDFNSSFTDAQKKYIPAIRRGAEVMILDDQPSLRDINSGHKVRPKNDFDIVNRWTLKDQFNKHGLNPPAKGGIIRKSAATGEITRKDWEYDKDGNKANTKNSKPSRFRKIPKPKLGTALSIIDLPGTMLMIRDMRMQQNGIVQVNINPVLEDENGAYWITEEKGYTYNQWKKVYIDGPMKGMNVDISYWDRNTERQKIHKEYGYVDIWGNFIRGSGGGACALDPNCA